MRKGPKELQDTLLSGSEGGGSFWMGVHQCGKQFGGQTKLKGNYLIIQKFFFHVQAHKSYKQTQAFLYWCSQLCYTQ